MPASADSRTLPHEHRAVAQRPPQPQSRSARRNRPDVTVIWF
jgi:hypothetical protein